MPARAAGAIVQHTARGVPAMAKHLSTPVFPTKTGSGLTCAPLMVDDLREQVFPTEARDEFGFNRQPLSHPRLLCAWDRATTTLLPKLRRQRAKIMTANLPLWQESPPELRQAAIIRAWAMIAAGCFEPDGIKLRNRWPENLPVGETKVPRLTPLTALAFLLLCHADVQIRTELAKRDSEYWEAANCMFGTFPEYFAWIVSEAADTLSGLPA